MDEDMADVYTRVIYETETIGAAWNHTHVQDGVKDILNELEALKVPVLFIHGENDYLPANPKNTEILVSHLPNAEFVMLLKAGIEYWHAMISR